MKHPLLSCSSPARSRSGCASNKPSTTPPTPPPDTSPIKTQEATPQQRGDPHHLAAGYERGQMDVALEELGAAKTLDPTYPKLYNIYGLVYAMLGEKDKAEENFRQAISLAPTTPTSGPTGARICARRAASVNRFPSSRKPSRIRCSRVRRSPTSTPASAAWRSARTGKPTNISAARSRRRRTTRSPRSSLRSSPTASRASTTRASGCARSWRSRRRGRTRFSSACASRQAGRSRGRALVPIAAAQSLAGFGGGQGAGRERASDRRALRSRRMQATRRSR